MGGFNSPSALLINFCEGKSWVEPVGNVGLLVVADDKDLVEFVENNEQLRPADVLVKHHFFQVMTPVKITT